MATTQNDNLHFLIQGVDIRPYVIAQPDPLPLGPGPFDDELQDYDPDAPSIP